MIRSHSIRFDPYSLSFNGFLILIRVMAQQSHPFVHFLGFVGRSIIAISVLFVILISIGNAVIYIQSQYLHPAQDADTILILGTGVEGSPTMPNQRLKSRLDAALDYWRAHPNAQIISTGGQNQQTNKSEAKVMQEYLMANGVPEAKITLEEDSTRIAHQFINSSALQPFGKKVVVVTNDYQLPRAMMLAKRSGLDNISGIGAPTPQDWNSRFRAYIREPLALINAWFFENPVPRRSRS
ncbi:YdcF family protein [Ignatzschineria ureiclastica]|uniref:YdcF family protein n=2 Tax=Ignatzschineria ureiclastica TaxID=472582 RepID=A0A2U2AGF1_9GAMM|nr:YdcF family protein [Ignatzschineria ureiclastica]